MAHSYLIYPLVTFFQYRLRLKNRVISIFCALFSILIVGGTAFYLLVPPMMDEFVRVKDLVIDYFSNGTHDGNVPKTLSEFLRENIDTQFVTQLFKEENMLNASRKPFPDSGPCCQNPSICCSVSSLSSSFFSI